MEMRIAACSVRGPGLPDWDAAAAILTGRAHYVAQEAIEPAPAMLPPNERRRMPDPARWALAVGHDALCAGGMTDADVATVFVSCGSDGKITQQICEALATPAREVSPTRFHNSVHNAPAGYWSIAMASCAPSTSLCAGAGSFGAALLEAAAQAVVEARPVLLIAYDLPYPEPLRAVWTLTDPFAVALLLAQPDAEVSGPRVRIDLISAPPGDDWPHALPRQLARNPAAAALPLLALVAQGGGHVVLPYLDQCSIQLEVMA
jgi:beta-ketoacyl synthase-like protein